MKEKFKQLRNRIRVVVNGKEAPVDEALMIEIAYSCGFKEKVQFLELLEHPQDYEALLLGDTTFQKTLRCNGHCSNRLRLLKLKPFKNEKDFQEIWNLQHGMTGKAELSIRIV